MTGTKTLTDRFLIALFKRGKAEYLPASYLKSEGGKVLAPGETDKLSKVLEDMRSKGILEEKDGEYKLVADPYA